jgi:hypothetical protein
MTRLGGGPRRIVNARGVESARQVGRVRYDNTPGRACRRTQAPHDSPSIRVCEYGEKYSVLHSCRRAARDGFSRMMAERELQRARGSREFNLLVAVRINPEMATFPH